MLTKECVLRSIQEGRESQCLDGRDYFRLADFFDRELDWLILGVVLKEGVIPPKRMEWSEENIKLRLKNDLAFAFEKALNRRGISALLMYEVVKMWLWILEDPLQHMKEYAMYGLPLLKAVAVKYGFENPIGEMRGDEQVFCEEDYI
jgi:hypothetical protein